MRGMLIGKPGERREVHGVDHQSRVKVSWRASRLTINLTTVESVIGDALDAARAQVMWQRPV